MLSHSHILFGLNSAQRLANRAAMSKSSTLQACIEHKIGSSCTFSAPFSNIGCS